MLEHTRMIVAPLARWSSRIALFSASLLLVGIALHRLTSLPTPVALNIFAVAFAGIGLATLVGLLALAQIWRRGYGGAASAVLGISISLACLGWPLTLLPAFIKQPPLNDITTDWNTPPRFAALASQRTGPNNAPVYPGERFAQLQQKAFPDLRTFVLDRPAEEAFELVEEAVHKLRWKVAVAQPPVGRPAKAGTLEATDQTLLVGFTDDIIVRVEGTAGRSRIDVRSASRYGKVDMGQNATRVRRFLAELQARADATAPAGAGGRRPRLTRSGALVKRLKERDPSKAEARNARDRAQPNTQRGRAQKETQR
jgi:hypothetical protein